MALAFAVLRETRLDDGPLSEVLLTEAARHDSVRLAGDRLRVVTWQSRVEEALGRWDTAAAAGLLRARPGELLRRLDLLLARSGSQTLPEPVGEVLAHALPRTAPGPLLGAYASCASAPFPGTAASSSRAARHQAYAVEDHRPPLPSRVAGSRAPS